MAPPLPPGEGPGALRRFLLPGLFVAGLFALLWIRRPPPAGPTGPGAVAAPLAGGRAYRFSGPTMGTTFNVTVVGALDPEAVEAARAAIVGALEGVDAEMSTYRPTSALSRFNAHRSTEPLPASPDLRAVLTEARRLSALSGGAFDITVGPLVSAWGFGPDRPGAAPDPATLSALRARVGWRRRIRPHWATGRLPGPGLWSPRARHPGFFPGAYNCRGRLSNMAREENDPCTPETLVFTPSPP